MKDKCYNSKADTYIQLIISFISTIVIKDKCYKTDILFSAYNKLHHNYGNER